MSTGGVGRHGHRPVVEGAVDPLPWSSTRLTLRRLHTDDLPRFQAYRHDAEVGRYQGWNPVSDDEARAFLAEMSEAPFGRLGEWLQIGIADAADDLLLGDLGLFVAASRSEAEFGTRWPARRRARASPRRPRER